MNLDSKIFERFRHFIARADDVPDVQAGSNLRVNAGSAIARSTKKIVGPETGITRGAVTLFVFATIVGCHGRERVRFLFQVARRDHVKDQGLIVAVLRGGKLLLRSLPTIGQIELYGSSSQDL